MVYYYYENSQYRFEANNNYLKNNGGEPTSASHVVIKYKNVYFDSYRVNDGFKEYDYSFDTDNVDFVIKSITNKNEWNSWFNRDKWIPKMEKKIGIKLFGTLNN